MSVARTQIFNPWYSVIDTNTKTKISQSSFCQLADFFLHHYLYNNERLIGQN